MHERAWVLPDEPVAVRLMNTVWADRRAVHDDLAAPADLDAWLRAAGFPVLPRATAGDLRDARRLRLALRRGAAAATGDDRARAETGLAEDDAVAAIDAALAGLDRPALTRVDGAWTFARRAPTGVAQALGLVAESGARLLAAVDPPLRACLAPGCVLYFAKDHPRRAWCSPACGTRARASRHYARHRGDPGRR